MAEASAAGPGEMLLTIFLKHRQRHESRRDQPEARRDRILAEVPARGL
jgi:hypothetical protein